MKKIFPVVVCFVLSVLSISNAQYADGGLGYMGQQGGMLMAGVGVTTIDDQTYFTINFRPELAFGKLGIGLNVNLLYDSQTGHIRSKDWDSGYDYFRILRYLRWGYKLDPVYARVGALDAARLGHGFIVNYYTNEASYDDRKIGMEFDLDFGQFGFESMTNNLGRAELVGGRGYYRPLRNLVTIPIIKDFAIGATYATDVDPDVSRSTSDGVSVYGFDAELPLIKTKIFNSMLYYDWAQISGYSSDENKSRTFGHGQAIGIQAGLGNMMGVLDVYAKLERRWLGKEFLPSFFDPFYEIQRYQVEGTLQLHKTDQLILITNETMGVFGELYGNVMGNKVRLLGMFTRLDDQKKSGTLHLAADAPDAVPTVAAHATYDKIGVESGKDLFTLDNQSIARVGLGYKIKPYLILYVDYIWTFVETEPNSKTYKPQERVEPKLVFAYQF